ncbi:EF-hand domain-containing protein [Actibacterium sp. 188UL27-1]|uniref:EF-hand domain-containing protein n=1 Tax=Actibacterium sp. 188UL27-1 TaxID=2786961 RepID=UPI001957C785|nr:EF-hand domain-containing protein [Actibacterium sp. 188UL27-1]MBM7067335.1 EF-hand domain-containing protein [Actibacterium sp. 188UL27-1]
MKTTVLGLGILSASILTALAVSAATEMDTDGDGMFSLTELQVAYPDLTAETYASLDANADGMVDPEELAAAQEAGVLPAS